MLWRFAAIFLIVWYVAHQLHTALDGYKPKIWHSDIPVKKLPCVLKGKGYGIIEDCGGFLGLERIAEAFDKKCQEYEQYCQWLGTNELDFNIFDADKINLALKDPITELEDFYEGD